MVFRYLFSSTASRFFLAIHTQLRFTNLNSGEDIINLCSIPFLSAMNFVLLQLFKVKTFKKDRVDPNSSNNRM
jgi:hypothetical protein